MTSTGDSTDLDERISSRGPGLREDVVRAAPAPKPEASQVAPEEPLERATVAEATRPARRWVRPALFLLLPLALIAGA